MERNDEANSTNEIEITKEMIAAGHEAISRRWLEFTSVSGHRLMDEVLREVFLAMWEAKRSTPS